MPGGGAAQGHPFPQSTGTRYRTPAPEVHNARGEELRSTETILHPTRAAKARQFLLGRTLDPLRTRSVRRASGSSSNGDIGNYNAAGLALAGDSALFRRSRRHVSRGFQKPSRFGE